VHEWRTKPPTALPIALIFDDSVGPDLQASVRKAAAYWNEQAGRPIFVDGRYALPDAYNDVALVRFEWASPDDPQHPERFELAVTSGDNVVTLYVGFQSEADADQETTARHELGHVLGFDHAKLPECLMYPVIHPRWYPMPLCQEEKTLLKEIVNRSKGAVP
jgi:hypothetical protein